MKKIIAFLCVLTLILSYVPDAAYADEQTGEIVLSYDNAGVTYPKGTKVKIDIEASNLNGASIEIYNNDDLICTSDADCESVYVVLNSGENNIYASADVGADNKVRSNTLKISAYDFIEVGELGALDFSDSKTAHQGTSGTTYSENPDKHELRCITDDASGNTYFYAKNITDNPRKLSVTFFVNSSHPEYQGSYVYEFDFMSPDPKEVSGNFISNSVWMPKDGAPGEYKSDWITTPASFIDSEGNISGTNYKINADTWYRIKLLYDFGTFDAGDTKKLYIFVNDEPVSSYDLRFQNATNVYFGRHKLYVLNSEACLDNIRAYHIAKSYKAEIKYESYDSQNVPYENTELTLEFDSEMNTDTLNNVNLIREDGKITEISFSPIDSSLKKFSVVVPKLNANTGYTIDLSGVKSNIGAPAKSDLVLSFKTEKLPFCIDEVNETLNGNILNLTVNMRNTTSEKKTYVVMAGLFKDNMLIEAGVKEVQGSLSSEELSFQYSKPDSEYEIRVCVFDSIQNINLLDKYSSD